MSQMSSATAITTMTITAKPAGPGVTEFGSTVIDGVGIGVSVPVSTIPKSTIICPPLDLRSRNLELQPNDRKAPAVTTAQELDERYGRTRRRRLPWIVGILLVIAVVGVFGWMTFMQSANSVDADDLGFEVADEHSVTVRFQVTGGQGIDVAGAIEALDEECGIVGWRIVEIPASDEHLQQLSTTVPTVAEATTGLVNSCWVA